MRRGHEDCASLNPLRRMLLLGNVQERTMAAMKNKIVVGIDVGQQHSHAVIMDSRRTILERPRCLSSTREFREMLRGVRPDVVAIDSPRRWACTSATSRECERVLLRKFKIHCFFTPRPNRARGNPFYAWVEKGIVVFRLATDLRLDVIEVFPNATAIILGGRAKPHESKVRWRRRIIRSRGVTVSERAHALKNVHEVDAALCALEMIDLWRAIDEG